MYINQRDEIYAPLIQYIFRVLYSYGILKTKGHILGGYGLFE